MTATPAAWGGATLTITVDGDDVTCDLIECVVDRSKNRLWDPPDAGTCQLTLNLNLGGQPAAAGQVGEQLRVKWAFAGVERWIFTGLIQRRRLEHNPIGGDLLVLDAVDEFEQLARLNLRAAPSDVGVGAGDTIDERLDRWLDEAGSTSTRALGVSEFTSPATLFDGNVLRELQRTALSDGGDLFVAGDGTVTFLPWRWRDDVADTAAVFSDRKLHEWVPYSAVDYHDDLDEVQNRVVGTRREPDEDKSPQTATHPASITAYGERGDALDDLELEDDTQVATRVGNVVEVAALPNPRFDSITVQPAFDPGRSWPRTIPVTFGSLIAANRQWADGTSSALYGHVIGEKWLITPDNASVTFRCSGTGTWDSTGGGPRPPLALERCPDGTLRIPEGYPCDDTSDVIIKDADGNVLATYPPGSLCECGVVVIPDGGVEICLDDGDVQICVPIDDERLDAILWVDAFEPVGPMIERIEGEELPGETGYDSVEIDVIDPGDYDAIWANATGGLIAAGSSDVLDAASFSGGWTVQLYLWLDDAIGGFEEVHFLASVGDSVQIVLTTEYGVGPSFPRQLEVRVWDGDDVLHLSGPMFDPLAATWYLVKVVWTGDDLILLVDGAEEDTRPWDSTFAPRPPSDVYAVELPPDAGIGEVLVWAEALIVIVGDYEDEVLADLPVGWWKLKELAGTIAVDFGTALDDGAYTGGYTLVARTLPAGIVGSAVELDGTTGYVAVGDNTLFEVAGTGLSFTFEAVVWHDANSGVDQIVSKGDSGGGNRIEWQFYIDGRGRLVATIGNTSNTIWKQGVSLLAVPTGEWAHVAARWDDSAATFDLWVNGNKHTSSVAYLGTRGGGSVHPVNVGRQADGLGFFDGNLAEVAIYDGALSDARIDAHYAASGITYTPPAVTTYPDLVLADGAVGYWKLDETDGPGAGDSADVVANGGTYTGVYTLAATALPSGVGGGSAVDLNGSSGYISVGDYTALEVSGPGLSHTIEAIVWHDANSGIDTIIDKYNSNAGGRAEWSFYIDGTGHLELNIGNNSNSTWKYFTSTATIPTGQWVHVAGRWDESAGQFSTFINGTKNSGVNALGGTRGGGSTTPVEIGRRVTAANYFDGKLAHISIYPTALSDAQIAAHYAATGI